MSDLTRRERERRGYQLVVVTGAAAVVAVVGTLLAIVGAIGAGLPLIAAIVAVIAYLMFRRLVSPS